MKFKKDKKIKEIKENLEDLKDEIGDKINKNIIENEEVKKKTNAFLRKFFDVCLKIKMVCLYLISKINISNLKLGKFNIKLSKEGRNTILIVFGVFVVSFITIGFGFLTTTLMFLLLMTVYFFRDPERVLPEKNNVLVSPCDGKILTIETSNLPSEISSKDAREYTKISICMNFNDVHVQRIPVDCKVKQKEYIKGTFINATLDKASKDNERNILLVERENGDNICIVQIAGLISRRIVCNVEKDEFCKMGERYGMIKFGSRVEIYIPKNYKIEVLAGQRVISGETVVASF